MCGSNLKQPSSDVNPTPLQAVLLHSINDYRRQRGRVCAALLESERVDRPTIIEGGLVDVPSLYDELNKLESLSITIRNLIFASHRAEISAPVAVFPLRFTEPAGRG